MMPKRRGFSIREPIFVALSTLRAHKLRSFLMLLGIILSVSTLIIVVSLIRGTNQYIQNRVANMGANVFLVERFGIITNEADFIKATRRNRQISYEDFEDLRDNLQLPSNVGLEIRRNGNVRYQDQAVDDVNIRGVTANIASMDVEEPATGRYISDSDNDHRSPVAFIGTDVVTKLFPTVEPIGKTINVDGHEYEIVGVSKEVGSVLGQSQDDFVYIPVTTWLKEYGNHDPNVNMAINVQARGPDWMERTQDEARARMRARRHLAPNEEDNFGITSSESVMGLWNSITGALASGMVGIVSVFLLIGGVVIMNVMLASVTERTREIGVRKSMGARRSDILMQFLVESSVMSAIGGFIGVAIATIIAVLVNWKTDVPMSVPLSAVVIALLVSTAVGMFFGVYPARRAAKLDPIEALRAET